MKRLMYFTVLILCTAFVTIDLPAQQHAEKEKKRMELNNKFDKYKLREKTEFVVDTSEKFLQPPAEPKEKLVGDFIVAKVPPTTKLQIVPNMKPEYFTEARIVFPNSRKSPLFMKS